MLSNKINILNLSHSTHGGYIRCLKNVRIVGLLSAFLLLALTLLSAFPIISHQEQAEATAGVAEVPTIAIATGNDQATVDIIPQDATGTYSSSDRTTSTNNRTASFSVTTSNYTGYTLGIKASDNAGQLVNASYSDTLDSITTATPATTFENDTTGTYTNKWGYKPNYLNSATNTDFLPAPTTVGTILDATNAAITRNYNIDVAAKVDYTKAAGTYTNTYILTATANPVAYVIKYWDVQYDTSGNDTYNSSTKKINFTTSPIATQQSAVNTAATVTLTPGVTRTRKTYTFKGWCYNSNHTVTPSVNDSVTAVWNAGNTKVTAYNNPATVCNGTIYNTGQSMPIDPTKDNTNINLYAVWEPTTFDQAFAAASKSKITHGSNSYYKMQDMTAAICAAVTPNQNTILVDNRKNTKAATTTMDNVGTDYHIAKLQDNRCWMLDNLDLNLNNSTVAAALSDSNTNANTASLNALKNGGGSGTNGLAVSGLSYTNWDVATGGESTKPMANRSGVCNTDIIGDVFQCLKPYLDNSYDNITVIDKYGPISSDVGATANTAYAIGVGDYAIGTYYNYCAASAGSYCYNSGYYGPSAANYDICPSNWTISNGDNSGSVTGSTHYLREEIKKISAYPSRPDNPLSYQAMLSTAFSGQYNHRGAQRTGSLGVFWTSKYYSDNADIMVVDVPTGTGLSVTVAGRIQGSSVRCIAKN